MAKNTKVLSVMAAIALFTLPALAQDADTSTVVATVGDREITVAHLLDLKQKLPEQYRTLPDDVLFPGLIDQLVQQEILAATVTDDPAWLAIVLENQRRSVLANDVIDRLLADAITEDALKTAYAQRYSAQGDAQEFNASHILVDSETAAQDLIDAFNNGTDFATLAQEHSTGPSGPEGGLLGWFGQGQMVPEFENAVVALDKGAISTPVQTQFGWHVIMLNDVRAVAAPPFEDVRADLERIVQNAVLEDTLENLTAQADVEINDVSHSVLSTLSLDDVE